MSLFTIRLNSNEQCDMECAVITHLIEKAVSEQYHKQHQWGECDVFVGDRIYCFQWSYSGMNDDLCFEDGVIDAEIDCSWRVY